MEMEVSSDLAYFEKKDWILWIRRVFEKGVAHPFFKTFKNPSEVLSGIFNLFSISSIPSENYHQALQEVLLEKLNSEGYGKSESLQQEAETLRKALEAFKSLKK
ncbi:MAG: hypothetical protein QG644_119 [Patescibacteria group bacterium]|nr:hypothetical protein [Patescibacteria group bacterium]